MHSLKSQIIADSFSLSLSLSHSLCLCLSLTLSLFSRIYESVKWHYSIVIIHMEFAAAVELKKSDKRQRNLNTWSRVSLLTRLFDFFGKSCANCNLFSYRFRPSYILSIYTIYVLFSVSLKDFCPGTHFIDVMRDTYIWEIYIHRLFKIVSPNFRPQSALENATRLRANCRQDCLQATNRQ